jgi:hypothetical protein
MMSGVTLSCSSSSLSFKLQLLLLHALDLDRVAAGRNHRVDGGVEVGMVLFQAGVLKSKFGLVLFGHENSAC